MLELKSLVRHPSQQCGLCAVNTRLVLDQRPPAADMGSCDVLFIIFGLF